MNDKYSLHIYIYISYCLIIYILIPTGIRGAKESFLRLQNYLVFISIKEEQQGLHIFIEVLNNYFVNVNRVFLLKMLYF